MYVAGAALGIKVMLAGKNAKLIPYRLNRVWHVGYNCHSWVAYKKKFRLDDGSHFILFVHTMGTYYAS